MFTKRMGSEKSRSEVLQDIFFKKEGPDRNKEGWKVHQNQYCSYDDYLCKLSAQRKMNTSYFQNVDGCKICFSCGNVASTLVWGMKND